MCSGIDFYLRIIAHGAEMLFIMDIVCVCLCLSLFWLSFRAIRSCALAMMSEESFPSTHAANQKVKSQQIFIDKLHTNGNILCQDSYSYQLLGSTGIKVPCREPWENKSFKRRNASWQPRRKPPRKRNTKRTMLV
jgi:hypothetical protein